MKSKETVMVRNKAGAVFFILSGNITHSFLYLFLAFQIYLFILDRDKESRSWESRRGRESHADPLAECGSDTGLDLMTHEIIT